jgi:arylsulfatase A-like enzyme/lipopolysaccharide biosynthesis regulator YciM
MKRSSAAVFSRGAIYRALHEGRNELRPYLMILFLIFLIFGCKEKSPTVISRSKQNVILISIDTVRSDYLKLYNPGGASTPNLEEFSKSAVLFKNVISQVPYTLPSHCTMLTGYYPATHHVRDNVHDILPANIPTLAELYQKAGYQTAGFVGSMVLSRSTGLGRGFSYYDDLFSRADVHGEDLGAVERPAEDVFASFENWFAKRNSDAKFFAFVHFYDPHSPYTPPGKFASPTNDVKEQYKGEIRYVDSVLGRLFGLLKNGGVWGNTVILITSDHGEMLNEHQEIGHGYFLYQPALHVPLLLYDPQRPAGKQIADITQLVDVAPTLVESSGIVGQKNFQGESLIPLLEGKSKKNKFAFSESYFASLQLGVSPLFSIQDLKFKFIQSPHPELFDLSQDASESRNLYAGQRNFAEKMQQKVAEYKKTIGSSSQKQQRSVSAEEQEKFAALGYLGGAVPEKEWNYNSDPKDFIQDWNASLEATMLVGQRQFPKALQILNKIRSKNSAASLTILTTQCYLGQGDFAHAEQTAKTLGDTPEGFGELAEVYAAQGKKTEAENMYKRSLEKQFSFFVLYNYVLYLKSQGKTADALTLLREAQSRQPDNDQSRSFFSEAYFLLEDFDASEKLSVRLIEDRPWELKWYLQISTIYQKRSELQRAISLMEANRNRFDQKPDYFLRLGILYKLNRDAEKEMESFKEMLRLNPQDARGYFYLAKTMLDQRQDLNAVVQLTGRGLQLSPDISMQIFGHYILSEAYEAAGRKKESLEELQTAQKLERS